jgi:hypothetical protein
MTILNPFAWGLLLPAVPVILFFFIKIRFRQEKSATNIFWQQVFEERRFRIIHRRFRLFVSLFSALLFLSLLTAAALNPVLSEQQIDRRIFIRRC